MEYKDRSERHVPSRREFVALGVGALVVATMPAALRRRRQLLRRTVPVMGTLAEIGVVHRDPRYAQAAIDAAIAELRRVDRTMTRFSHHSEVGQANLHAARKPVAISPETATVLAEALRWAAASDGSFDPCLGRTLELWDVGTRRTPPAEDEVRGLASRSLYRYLELERRADGSAVRFHDPDVAIDLGGIAKGYAIDRAAAALRRAGVDDALVNVGDDIFALGAHPRGGPWRIGVRHPRRAGDLLRVLPLRDGAVATSGDYHNFFIRDGRRYHHLLDPRTGRPAPFHRSLTVTAPTAMLADALATAGFAAPPERTRRLLRAFAAGPWLAVDGRGRRYHG